MQHGLDAVETETAAAPVEDAELADRVDVRETHLHQIPQAGPPARGRKIDAPLLAESRRGLSVRPLIIDLGRDFRGGQDQALLLLRGLAARGQKLLGQCSV